LNFPLLDFISINALYSMLNIFMIYYVKTCSK